MARLTVLVDADSCPAPLRAFLAEEAARRGFTAHFVANRAVEEERDGVEMTVCGPESGAADDAIVSLAGGNDIVVTRDIPLAARLVEKGVAAMNDRGTLFTKDNIEERLLERSFSMNLAEIGFTGSSRGFYGERELRKFRGTFGFLLERRLPSAR